MRGLALCVLVAACRDGSGVASKEKATGYGLQATGREERSASGLEPAPPSPEPSATSTNDTPASSATSEALPADAAAIRTIVRGNFSRLRACYEAGLKRNPSLLGRVKVVFTIKPDGTVEKLDTETPPLVS